jgi:hypothetical protein
MYGVSSLTYTMPWNPISVTISHMHAPKARSRDMVNGNRLTFVQPNTPACPVSLVDVQLVLQYIVTRLVRRLPVRAVRGVIVHRPKLAVPDGALPG